MSHFKILLCVLMFFNQVQHDKNSPPIEDDRGFIPSSPYNISRFISVLAEKKKKRSELPCFISGTTSFEWVTNIVGRASFYANATSRCIATPYDSIINRRNSDLEDLFYRNGFRNTCVSSQSEPDNKN